MNQSCGHILHIDKDSTVKTTLQLTLLKHTSFQTEGSISTKDVISFIQLVVKQNPIWDIGFQFRSIRKNPEKIYTNVDNTGKKYTQKCICPCSLIFRKCHYYVFLA